MAVGQTYAVQSGTAQQYFIPSGFNVPTVGVLNPNDGITYVARNRQASNTSVGSWDYKVPSQSYAILPGGLWQSVGIFYIDQSGSNNAGEVTVYPLETQYSVPVFQAIGRAQQTAGTAVDITQGSQPANPPANVGRLWVDGAGNLNLLSSTGANRTEIDNVNAPTYVNPLINSAISAQVPPLVTSGINAQVPAIVNGTALGGDLSGTVNNGRVTAHTGPITLDAGIQLMFNGNDANHRIYQQSNALYFDEYGTFVWRCSARSYAQTLSLDSTGNLTVGASVYLNSNQWLMWQGSTNGIISDTTNLYLRTNGVVDIQNTGGGLTTLNAGTLNASSVVQTQNQIQWTADGSYCFVSGGYIYFRSSANGIVIQTTGGGVAGLNCGSINTNNQGVTCGALDSASGWIRSQSGDLYLTTNGDRMHDGGDNNNWVFYGPMGSVNFVFQHRDSSWMGTQAANFQTMSDWRSKMNVTPITDMECMTRLRTPSIPVVVWDTQNAMALSPSPQDIGFIAQDMATAVPEVVSVDNDGNHFLSYGNLTAVLWGALRNLDSRVSALGG